MSTITLNGSNTAAVRDLAQALWNALGSTTIQTGNGQWPFSPDSLDFSSLGACTISVSGITGDVSYSFAVPQSPVITGVLNLVLLEDQLASGPPNYVQAANDGLSGRPGSLSGSTVTFGGSYISITRRASGIIYVSGEMHGTESAQTTIDLSLYRDSTLIYSSAFDPGGIPVNPPYNWSFNLTTIDMLPDGNAHQYSLVASATGGSTLTVGLDATNFQLFELGGPG